MQLNLNELNNEEEILLAAVLNQPREFLIAHYGALRLSAMQARKFSALRRKLAAGWPLAYLLSYRWFFNRKFFVSPSVLIPRPETELLVERALSLAQGMRPKFVIDIGTGSGAIVVSLRKEIGKGAAKFFATDVSPAALKVARKNASALKAGGIKFMRGNLLAPLAKTLHGKKNVLICANLPYISKKELNEASIKHEPRLALYGGANPTKKIQKLLLQISKLDLKNSAIFLEFNWDQAAEIKKLASQSLPAARVTIHKDLNKFNRFAEIILP